MDRQGQTEGATCDVLVIGGGFAGLYAALRAAELGAAVILVEKAFVSRSGASTVSGGVTSCPMDHDDLDVWAREFIVRGGYTSDQDWTRKMLAGQRERVKELAEWGVPISRDEKGEIRRFASRGMIAARCMQFNPKRAMEILRARAVAAGVRILDRVSIVDLLRAPRSGAGLAPVCGAAGFHVRAGSFHVIRARRTILATGMISMRLGVHLVDNDSGDGIAMAWRSGATLVDLEFTMGGTFSIGLKKYKLSSYNIAVGHGAWLVNARGERFMEKYDPLRFERGELPLVIAAFVKELLDGRGPCYLDLTKCDESYWRDLPTIGRGGLVLLSDRIPDPRKHPLLIEPVYGLWTSDGRSGIRVDLECHTDVPGLLAAGACAKNLAIGTHGSAGGPTAWAMNSGWTAGETAARECGDAESMEPSSGEVEKLREFTFAPLSVSGGPRPDELHDRLSAFENDLVHNIVLNEANIRARVASAEDILALAETASARDLHDLVKLHEARSLALCARLVYLSALDRTESREQFYREEFPHTNDEQWFCWHGVSRGKDGPEMKKIPIPIDRWDVQPPEKRMGLSPIAALMKGCYDPRVYDHQLRPLEKAAAP